MAATLAGEPWCFTPEQIGTLTLAQVNHLYFRHRDKEGQIRRDPDKIGTVQTPREEFVARWQRWGLSRERAEEKWREAQKEARARRKARDAAREKSPARGKVKKRDR